MKTEQEIGEIILVSNLVPLKMIPGCRQAISILFDAFSILITTYFNLHLPKFAKPHYLFEFGTRQTIFFEIKCLFRAIQMIPYVYMVVSFVGVQFKSKHLREKEKRLSFWKNFDLRFLF